MVMSHSNRQKGFALIGVLLFLVLLTALAITLTYTTMNDKRMSGSDQEGAEAYYAAEAGMEKMTADLGGLYTQTKAPKASQITALGNSPPALSDVSYAGPLGYQLALTLGTKADGTPVSQVQTISSGAYAGLSALVIPITLDVTATRGSGAQVHLTRQVEVAEIPVFQFGVFSDSDLSYFAGPNFDFAGRVHTNGDLYLAEGNGSTLTFHDKITASGEIIRQTLVNGLGTGGNYTGTVDIPTAANGCSGASCRALALNEGSLTGGKGSAPTPGWDTFAQTNYFNMLVRHTPTLSLPFVQDGTPIEIIREPLPTDSTNLSASRLYNQAQIRVLLADSEADMPPSNASGTPGGDVNLNVPDACFPVDVAGNTCVASANDASDSHWKRPVGTSGDWSLLNGSLRVEARQADGSYKNVTQEWLDRGFARGLQTPDVEHGRANTVNPNAILILQQLKDTNTRGTPDCGTTMSTCRTGSKNWLPLNFYDTREGERRENAQGGTNCSAGGIMNGVEVDVGNLKKWLTGAIGTTGVNVESASQNGYILYYADHRGMSAGPVLDMAGNLIATTKHGDFGYEDFINPGDVNGLSNGVLDPGEDVNNSSKLDTNGATGIGVGFGLSGSAANDPSSTVVSCADVGRMNRVSGPRHAIVAVNGTLGNLPTNFAAGGGGFTIASEEPVYIVGNYNASDALGFGDPHAEAAAIADTVTLLSNNWSNEQSMFNPRTAVSVPTTTSAACPGAVASLASPQGFPAGGTGRFSCTTWYRLAIASGKSIPFQRPGWGAPNDFGTDGGVHNFLRYLEDWGGQTSHYQGSMVSLYYAQNGVGVFKCCNMVYTPPTRAYAFDIDFLDPNKMPPGTPRFIDVNNVDVVQDMKPR